MNRRKERLGRKTIVPPASNRAPWIVGGGVVIAGIVALMFWKLAPVHSTSTMAASTNSAFAPTISNKTAAPGPAPEGMVWIPGGEFSMGSDAASESLCGLPGVTRDALPIHGMSTSAPGGTIRRLQGVP